MASKAGHSNGSQPHEPPASRRPTEPGAVRIVARYLEGRLLKGYTYDFSPIAPRFRLYPVREEAAEPDSRPTEVALQDLKAVFFVRKFEGNPGYEERKHFADGDDRRGRRVEVVFTDGETMTGYTVSYDKSRPGFFLFPVDRQSNNQRVFVISQAVSEIRAPATPTTAAAGGGGDPVSEPTDRGAQAADVVKQMSASWESLKGQMEKLAWENQELRERCARLEREPTVLREAHARLGQEHVNTSRALESLRTDHERLRREHEADVEELSELRQRHDALLRETAGLGRDLEGILRRISTMADAGGEAPDGRELVETGAR